MIRVLDAHDTRNATAEYIEHVEGKWTRANYPMRDYGQSWEDYVKEAAFWLQGQEARKVVKINSIEATDPDTVHYSYERLYVEHYIEVESLEAYLKAHNGASITWDDRFQEFRVHYR